MWTWTFIARRAPTPPHKRVTILSGFLPANLKTCWHAKYIQEKDGKSISMICHRKGQYFCTSCSGMQSLQYGWLLSVFPQHCRSRISVAGFQYSKTMCAILLWWFHHPCWWIHPKIKRFPRTKRSCEKIGTAEGPDMEPEYPPTTGTCSIPCKNRGNSHGHGSG